MATKESEVTIDWFTSMTVDPYDPLADLFGDPRDSARGERGTAGDCGEGLVAPLLVLA